MSDEREIERSVTREEAVATMQAVVDGVASGTLRFDAADVETVDVEVPDVVELEVELELEEDGAELEVELEWPVEERPETDASPDEQDTESSEDPGSEAAAGGASETASESETETASESGAETTAESGSEVSGDREGEEAAAVASDLESDGPHAIDAAVIGPAEPRESLARFEVYRDRAEEWRWRLVHHNGNVIADGGEGYASKQSALKGLRSVMANAPGASVQDESKQ